MCKFLDEAIFENFKKALIQIEDLWLSKSETKKSLLQLFAVRERLENCLRFLNHTRLKDGDEEPIKLFVLQACTLIEGVEFAFKVLGQTDEDWYDKEIADNLELYQNLNSSNPLFEEIKPIETHKIFFQYFRALTFAHPFETSRLLKDKTKPQYSPFLVFRKAKPQGQIVIRIFSTYRLACEDWRIPFNDFQEYIGFHYSLLQKITQTLEEEYESFKKEGLKKKVNRSGSDVDTLRSIKEVLEERLINTQSIEELINFYTLRTSSSSHDDLIHSFRQMILGKIPSLCDAVDKGDYAVYEAIISQILCPSRNDETDYAIGKIFSCFDDSDDHCLEVAREETYKLNRLLNLDLKLTEYLTITEIKLLISAALYAKNGLSKNSNSYLKNVYDETPPNIRIIEDLSNDDI